MKSQGDYSHLCKKTLSGKNALFSPLERQQIQLALAPHTHEKHECTVVIKLSYCRLMNDNYKLTVSITDSWDFVTNCGCYCGECVKNRWRKEAIVEKINPVVKGKQRLERWSFGWGVHLMQRAISFWSFLDQRLRKLMKRDQYESING